jgi:hypothetical protein
MNKQSKWKLHERTTGRTENIALITVIWLSIFFCLAFLQLDRVETKIRTIELKVNAIVNHLEVPDKK